MRSVDETNVQDSGGLWWGTTAHKDLIIIMARAVNCKRAKCVCSYTSDSFLVESIYYKILIHEPPKPMAKWRLCLFYTKPHQTPPSS